MIDIYLKHQIALLTVIRCEENMAFSLIKIRNVQGHLARQRKKHKYEETECSP